MSYYEKKNNSLYNFSNHSLQRIKNRLKLELPDYQLESYCLDLIAKSFDIIETTRCKYIRINDSSLYFIINKRNNLVLTVSPISEGKLLAIIDEDF